MASIAAVSRARKTLALLAVSAAAAVVVACGESDPEPSIPLEDAEALAARIDEIRANVDNGSCLVAVDRTDDLIAEINGLPDDVDQDVKNALAEGANNLKELIEDPEQCEQPEETTTEETTTEETTTEETETQETTTEETQPTTPTQQTTPTQPGQPGGGQGGGSGGTGGSGGVGPGGFE